MLKQRQHHVLCGAVARIVVEILACDLDPPGVVTFGGACRAGAATGE